ADPSNRVLGDPPDWHDPSPPLGQNAEGPHTRPASPHPKAVSHGEPRPPAYAHPAPYPDDNQSCQQNRTRSCHPTLRDPQRAPSTFAPPGTDKCCPCKQT